MDAPVDSAFSFASDTIDLPPGAWAKAHRRSLRRHGREVLALTQGGLRSYIYPLHTPAGVGPITPGDVVEIEIEEIGTLRNPVVAEA